MSERPVLRVAGRVTECVACRLAAFRHRSLRDKRAIFYHLLWHRDAGDDVPSGWLDSFDEDIRDPDENYDRERIGQLFGVDGSMSEFSQGIYGLDAEGHRVFPARMGRGRAVRVVGARSKSVES